MSCTADGIGVTITNGGEAGTFDLTLNTASGETESETVELGAGESIDAGVITEDFTLTANGETLVEGALAACAAIPTPPAAGELPPPPVVDGLSATTACTPDGFVVTFTNNGTETTNFELVINTNVGDSSGFTTGDLAPGASQSTPPIPEDFEYVYNGETVAQGRIADCDPDSATPPTPAASDGTADTGSSSGTLTAAATCADGGVAIAFTNTTSEDGNFEVTFRTGDGETNTATLDIAAGQVFRTPSVAIDQTVEAIYNDNVIVSFNGADCTQPADYNVTAAAVCTDGGITIAFTNNGNQEVTTSVATAPFSAASSLAGIDENSSDEARAAAAQAFTFTTLTIAPGATQSTAPSRESVTAIYGPNDAQIMADVTTCNNNAAFNVSAEPVCTDGGIAVAFTNNGSEPTVVQAQIVTDSALANMGGTPSEEEMTAALASGGVAISELSLAPGTTQSIAARSETFAAVYGPEPTMVVADVDTCGNQPGAASSATPAPAATATASGQASGTVDDFLPNINAVRALNGLGPVSYNAQLTEAARLHSQDMSDRGYFDHTAPAPAPNGAGIGDRVTAAGYTWTAVAENIAQGQTSEKAVFESWMDSEGHRANMLNGTYTEIGLAQVGGYWTLVLATN